MGEDTSMNDQGSMMKLPSRQVLTNEVYENIKSQLMDQHIQPGARINIDKVARQLQVSHTPIREALARLASEGLVTKEPLRGYSAVPLLDVSSFQQLYEMRLLLEPNAARKAAEMISDYELLILEQQIATMQAGRLGQSYEEYQHFFATDATFHDAIAHASGNLFLQEALERLNAHLHLYRLYFHAGTANETIAEHQEILAALHQRDADAAAACMVRHLEQARLRLIQRLEPLHTKTEA